MNKFMTLFLIGGTGYAILELLWRGHTHWTMFILGGICLYLLFTLFSRMETYSVITKAFWGGIVITAAEFVTGCIVNLALDWDVWNYSDRGFDLLGQICPLYSILWMLLCIPISYLCLFFKKYIR